MRNDVHDLSLEERIGPLVAAAPQAHTRWLRKLLLHPESMKAFSAVDSELYLRKDAETRGVAIASSGRADGRTTFALALAILAAALDPSRRVLLVDCDHLHGCIAGILGLPSEAAGIAEAFAGTASFKSLIHPTALPNLFVVPQGSDGARALAFAPRPFEALLDEARGEFDAILVDTAAATSSKAVLQVAKIAGRALLVVRYAGATREQVGSLAADLIRTGADLMGCVMNQRQYVVPALLYGRS